MIKTANTFSILVGDQRCPNKCPFCIARMTPSGGMSLDVNWKVFVKACKIAKDAKVRGVLLTGKGEPTLHPVQITRYLHELEKYNFPTIELQTDGDSMFRQPHAQSFLTLWKEMGLDLIAISMYHYNSLKNDLLFGTPQRTNLITVIQSYQQFGFNIRLSCLLCKGFIDSIDDIENLIAFARGNSILQLTLRTLGKAINVGSKNPYAKAVDEYYIPQKKLDVIQNYFDENGKLLYVLSHGARVYDYKGQNVCLTDCLSRDYDQDEVRSLIFFPEGWLTTSWEYPYSCRLL